MPINSRAKGAAYELQIIKKFKDLGWNCVSSRSESKRTDDAGVDLCYTEPFQIQAKAVERLGNYHDILKGMPDKKGVFNLIFHKRNRKGSTVVMSEESFFELLEIMIANKIIKPGT